MGFQSGDTENNLTGGHQHNAFQIGTIWIGTLFKALPSAAGWLLALELLSLLVAAWNWPNGPLHQYVLFGALGVGALLAVGGSVVIDHLGDRPTTRGRRRKHLLDAVEMEARAEKRHERRLLAQGSLLVVSLLFSAGGLWAFEDVVRTGEVDAPVTLRSGEQPMKGTEPGALVLTVDRDAPGNRHSRLRLHLAVEDWDEYGSSCIPDTRVTVTADTPGITPRRQDVGDDATVVFDLNGERGPFRFTYEVHTEYDHCAMRLAEKNGTLHN